MVAIRAAYHAMQASCRCANTPSLGRCLVAEISIAKTRRYFMSNRRRTKMGGRTSILLIYSNTWGTGTSAIRPGMTKTPTRDRAPGMN